MAANEALAFDLLFLRPRSEGRGGTLHSGAPSHVASEPEKTCYQIKRRQVHCFHLGPAAESSETIADVWLQETHGSQCEKTRQEEKSKLILPAHRDIYSFTH